VKTYKAWSKRSLRAAVEAVEKALEDAEWAEEEGRKNSAEDLRRAKARLAAQLEKWGRP
jgi:hypothetical protein